MSYLSAAEFKLGKITLQIMLLIGDTHILEVGIQILSLWHNYRITHSHRYLFTVLQEGFFGIALSLWRLINHQFPTPTFVLVNG